MYKVGDLVRVISGEDKGHVYEIKGIGTNILNEDIYLYSDGMGKGSYQIEPVTHLTTKEFIELVEDMGYIANEYKNGIEVRGIHGTLGEVLQNNVNLINTNFRYNCSKTLFKVLTLYASTPLELREEKEQLYTLELPNNKHRNRFYCHQVSSGNYSFGKLNPDVNRQPDHIKHFTQKEIDELPNQELIKTLIKKEVKENDND